MKKQENYKDIYKALKDDTDFPLPETLAPDAIVKTVASVRVQPKKRHTARYASLAAALVLVTLAGVVGIRLTNAPQNGGIRTENGAKRTDSGRNRRRIFAHGELCGNRIFLFRQAKDIQNQKLCR